MQQARGIVIQESYTHTVAEVAGRQYRYSMTNVGRSQQETRIGKAEPLVRLERTLFK